MFRRLHQSGSLRVCLVHSLLTRSQLAGHVGDEHRCSALVHMCGEVCPDSFVLWKYLITVARSLAPSRA